MMNLHVPCDSKSCEKHDSEKENGATALLYRTKKNKQKNTKTDYRIMELLFQPVSYPLFVGKSLIIHIMAIFK